MTLDEPTNWRHAAALERGEDPSKPSAQFRLATLLAEHDDLHTIHHHMLVAGRVLAFLPRIQAWADSEKPKVSAQLRQQQTASLSDEDEALERAGYHKRGYEDAVASLAALGSVYAPSPVDLDEVGADEDSARISRERADDEAAAGMPKGLAS